MNIYYLSIYMYYILLHRYIDNKADECRSKYKLHRKLQINPEIHVHFKCGFRNRDASLNQVSNVPPPVHKILVNRQSSVLPYSRRDLYIADTTIHDTLLTDELTYFSYACNRKPDLIIQK